MGALSAIGYRPNLPIKVADFADPAIRFEELWNQSVEINLPGSMLRIASIDHLILMKREAGRPQDLLDIDKLEKLKRFISEQGSDRT